MRNFWKKAMVFAAWTTCFIQASQHGCPSDSVCVPTHQCQTKDKHDLRFCDKANSKVCCSSSGYGGDAVEHHLKPSTHQEHSHDRHNDYDRRGNDYDRHGNDYDHRGNDYDHRGNDYDHRGNDYDHRGNDYDHRSNDYDHRGNDYDHRGNDYDHRTNDYDRRNNKYETPAPYSGRQLSTGYDRSLSYEARRILGSYVNKECGLRSSLHSRHPYTSGHDIGHGTTRYGEFPWQVAILVNVRSRGYGRTLKFYCGGALISRKLVVTAAHCVKGVRISDLQLRLGEWNLKGSHGELFPAVKRGVKRVILHEYYNPSTFAHDIALVVMSGSVDLSRTPHVAPICIPPKHARFGEHTKCFVTGWGRDDFKPNYESNLLKYASVSLMKDDCPHKLKKAIPSLANNFFRDDVRCIAGSLGKSTCVGDGGGAVVCPLPNKEEEVCPAGYECAYEHYFVAGVISWGDEHCGHEDGVTVVTDFLEHRDWVLDRATAYDPTFDRYGFGFNHDSIGYGYGHGSTVHRHGLEAHRYGHHAHGYGSGGYGFGYDAYGHGRRSAGYGRLFGSYGHGTGSHGTTTYGRAFSHSDRRHSYPSSHAYAGHHSHHTSSRRVKQSHGH